MKLSVLTCDGAAGFGPLRTAREGCGVGGLFYRQGAKDAKVAKKRLKPFVFPWRPLRSLRLGGEKKVAQSAYATTRASYATGCKQAPAFHASRNALSAMAH
jgi:hypothetical protein